MTIQNRRIKVIKSSKELFTIGEASELVGVQQHVLRNWEKEFPFIKPVKKESGHRLYTKNDILLLLRIKELLYDELYTIKGARKKLLKELNTEKKEVDYRELLKKIKKELKSILNLLK